MENKRHIETIAFMGWNRELTREGFFQFLEENKEIKLIGKPIRHGSLKALGPDGTLYFTLNPDHRHEKRTMAGRRIDQLILCDDERKNIYGKHRDAIREVRQQFTGQVPEECEILFYEYK